MGDRSLQAGAAVVDITGPLGLDLGGGALGPARKVLHRIHARCVCLQADGRRILLFSCDLLGFEADYARDLRADVAAACGTSPEAVMLAATHTHAAPATVSLRNWGRADPGYLATLRARLMEAAQAAVADLRPARLAAGSGRVPGVCVNRSLGAGGPVDDWLLAVRIEDLAGRPVVVLVNFAGHPVNLHGAGVISGDYPHYLQVAVQRALGGDVPVLFLQGAAGDLNPANFVAGKPSEAAAEQTGSAIAAEVMKLPMRPIACDRIGFAAADVPVGLQPLPSPAELRAIVDERGPKLAAMADRSPTNWTYAGHKTAVEWAREALDALATGRPRESQSLPLQALRIGPVGIVALPGELFSEYGLAIRQAAILPHTLVVTLANGCCGYFPSPAAYEKKTYEAVHCPRYLGLYLFDQAIGQRVSSAAMELLRGL